MPPGPKVAQTTLSTDHYQLLCQVVQHCEPPKKEAWDVIAQKLGITNGNAAQQRFGRLLKALKAGDATGSPAGSPSGGTSKAKAAGKRSTSRKTSGKKGKQAKSMERHDEEDEGDENDGDGDELSEEEEETPTKKLKTDKGKAWKSVFGRPALKDKYEAEDEVAGPAVGKKDGYY